MILPLQAKLRIIPEKIIKKQIMSIKIQKIIIGGLLVALTYVVSAQQNNPIVMILGQDSISLSDFKNTYTKNNDLSKATKADIDSYIDLYINFRLKYAEAKALHLDTLERLQRELNGYREQASAQYLTDKDVNEVIYNEVLERMQWDIRASHILKKVASDASPKDTLAAYKSIMQIRDRLLKGEDFATLAQELSDDPSAKDKRSASGELIQYGNHGDLGYFTVFDMIYSFETGAYNTPVGTLSMPIRTEFGYHLIFVQDKKPALGKCKAVQMMCAFNRNVNLTDNERQTNEYSQKLRVDSIYQDLLNGMDFETARIKYFGDNAREEIIPMFSCSRFEGDFVAGLYGLKAGEYSKPLKTRFGWHIVKLTETNPVNIDEDTKSLVKMKIMRDSRSNKSVESFIERVKNENGFKEFKTNKNNPLADFYTVLDSSIFMGTFKAEMLSNMKKAMFVLGKNTYTQQDFAAFLEKHPFTDLDELDLVPLVNLAYKNFVDITVIQYEDDNLENKYPSFATLMEEYKEGILLYELSEQKVWKKAETDSLGLDNFYQTVKHKYLYPNRIQFLDVKCVDKKVMQKAKAAMEKSVVRSTSAVEAIEKLNVKSVTCVLDTLICWKGQNPTIDKLCDWNTAKQGDVFVNEENNEVMQIQTLLAPSPKPLAEIKGLVISEYQDVLEKEWIEQLHRDNKVWVDRQTIYTLINK